MNIQYYLSQEALDQEFIATGIQGKRLRTLKIDPTSLTPEQRSILVKYLSQFSIIIRKYAIVPFQANGFVASPPRIGLEDIELPAEPTVDEVIAHLLRMEAERAEAEAKMPAEKILHENHIAERAKERALREKLEAEQKEAAAQRAKEKRLSNTIIPWNDQGKAIVNLYEAIFAATNFERDGREGFAAWVKEVEHIDPTQPNGYSIVGSWVNDRTVEIERGQRHVYLVANQTGSRKNRTTEYTVIAMDDDGVLHTTDIFTDDADKGWALRIRDQIAALL